MQCLQLLIVLMLERSKRILKQSSQAVGIDSGRHFICQEASTPISAIKWVVMNQNVDDIRRKKTGKLCQQGYDCLAEGDYEAALSIAKELEALRNSAAFEIGALAMVEKGDLDGAIDYLRQGVSVAPQSWLNWQLLGNYLSDTQSYAEAHEAFQQARACNDTWVSSVCLNQAILSNRQEQYDKTLEILQDCTDPELHLHKAEVQIYALAELGQLEQASSLAQRLLDDWNGWEQKTPEQAVLIARVAASLGRVQLSQGDSRDKVRAFSLESLDIDPNSHSLFALIREIDDSYSPDAKAFLLTANCHLPELHNRYQDAIGFFVNYEVVADTTEEAMEYIAGFEDPALRQNLLLEKVEVIQSCPNDAKGVVWRSDRIYYNDEE